MNEELLKSQELVGQARELGVTGAGVDALGAITSENLGGNTTPVNIPTPTPQTTAAGISAEMTSYGQSQKALQDKLDAQAQETRLAKDTEKKGLTDTISQYLGIQSSRGQAEQDAGLDVKAQKVTQYTNQLEALDRAELNEIRALDNMPGTLEQRGQRTTDIQRYYAFRKADTALLQAAANRDLETASNIINRKIELQLEPLKTKLEFQKFFYEDNKDLFDKAEQRQFDSLVKATEREYEQEKTARTEVKDVLIKYLENNPNPKQSIVSQLSNAKDGIEAGRILLASGESLVKPKAGTTSPTRTITDPVTGETRVVSTLSNLTQSIIENPSLFDDLTPTRKGEVITELQANDYDTSNLGVKGLSDTAINLVAQTQKALDDLAVLRGKIEGNEQFIGPISGLQRFNPYSKARQIQADVDRVRQTVGKALEGGVLRKEDEEKYKKILATLADTPETATYKIDALINSIQRDIETYKSLQQSGGRSADVGASLKKKGEKTENVDFRSKYKY